MWGKTTKQLTEDIYCKMCHSIVEITTSNVKAIKSSQSITFECPHCGNSNSILKKLLTPQFAAAIDKTVAKPH